MSNQKTELVVTEDGLRGRILQMLPASDGQPARALIRFDNGQQMVIAREALELQGDGSFHLAFDKASLNAYRLESQNETQVLPVLENEARVLPVIEEELRVERRTRTTGLVQVRKVVREHEEQVDEPILRESVEVERVPINQVLAEGDEAGQVRHDGDTMIIPVLEEVLVVEKRLLLKEEIHITRRRTQERIQQQVTLRSEDVVVDRVAPEASREVGGKDSA